MNNSNATYPKFNDETYIAGLAFVSCCKFACNGGDVNVAVSFCGL